MRYLDLFSGLGGFALGAYWAGWRFDEHYFSEVDEYAIKVYRQRFPDAIALGDITQIDGRMLPHGEWIVTGGFPCQDISIAGKGKGIGGERSSLWFEMRRIIRQLRPQWVIIENVGAITIRGLSVVLNLLAKIGFDGEWQDIRASDMGAPHKRERIWIVAYPSGERWRREQAGSSECEIQAQPTDYGQQESLADSERARELQPEGLQQDQRGRTGDSSETMADTQGHAKGRLSIGEIEEESRLNGGSQNVAWRERWNNEEEWLAFAGICRVSHGVRKRVDRLKCLGNAVLPQIAELLFRRIKCLEE